MKKDKQLTFIEDLYESDFRKATLAFSLIKISRDLKYVYGLLHSYESELDMFSPKRYKISKCVKGLNNLGECLGLIMYAEFSDTPKLSGLKIDDIIEQHCKMKLVGKPPACENMERPLNLLYTIPEKIEIVEDEIEEKRYKLFTSTLRELLENVEAV